MTSNSSLQYFLKKPALYFGNREGYLRDIEALDAGYRLGITDTMAAGSAKPQGLIPEAFADFVVQRLPPSETGAVHWAARIRSQAHGEREEWELFLKLYNEYLHETA